MWECGAQVGRADRRANTNKSSEKRRKSGGGMIKSTRAMGQWNAIGEGNEILN